MKACMKTFQGHFVFNIFCEYEFCFSQYSKFNRDVLLQKNDFLMTGHLSKVFDMGEEEHDIILQKVQESKVRHTFFPRYQHLAFRHTVPLTN